MLLHATSIKNPMGFSAQALRWPIPPSARPRFCCPRRSLDCGQWSVGFDLTPNSRWFFEQSCLEIITTLIIYYIYILNVTIKTSRFFKANHTCFIFSSSCFKEISSWYVWPHRFVSAFLLPVQSPWSFAPRGEWMSHWNPAHPPRTLASRYSLLTWGHHHAVLQVSSAFSIWGAQGPGPL